jgi:hypothetical protein
VAIGAPFVGLQSGDCTSSGIFLDWSGTRDCSEAGQVFVRSWSGSTWAPVGQSIVGESRSRLGWSVDISADGSTMVAGAPKAGLAFYGLINPGEVRMYRLDGA